jgi:hypothetical protein
MRTPLLRGSFADKGGAAIEALDEAVQVEVEAEGIGWRHVGQELDGRGALFVLTSLLLALAARHGQRALRQAGLGRRLGLRFQVVEKILHVPLLACEPALGVG